MLLCNGAQRHDLHPVHDAVLIEAADDQIDLAISKMQQAMADASALVLDGFRLRTKVEAIVRYPDRYMDEKRGRTMWEKVMSCLEEVERNRQPVT